MKEKVSSETKRSRKKQNCSHKNSDISIHSGSSKNIGPENKHYRKSNIIYGTAENTCNIKATPKYVHFHVYRLDPNLSVGEFDIYLT